MLMQKTLKPKTGQRIRLNKRYATLFLCTSLVATPVLAEILNSSTPWIRMRLGSNTVRAVETVIYNAGIPAALGGLPGVTAAPQTISTNAISGGSGVYEVRIVTDLNRRNASEGTVTGTFSYDSSTPMLCTTAATCGATTIPFTTISWNTRDNDTHTAVTQFDGTANQVTQVQVDTNSAINRDNTRHRNYFQYIFANTVLYPAGTYEGQIQLNGVGSY